MAITSRDDSREGNVSEGERWVSLGSGSVMALFGLSRGNLGGFLLAALGGGLIYRGVSGNCTLYRALGINTARPEQKPGNVSVPDNRGVKVEHAVTINKPIEEVNRYWRDFENLPRFMKHLLSVTVYDDNRSHWVAKAPAGSKVEWDAEIIAERENEMIAWRSLENADINNAGSVHFSAAPTGRGTQVRVQLNYDPPAGKIGAALLKLTGEEPSTQVKDDLTLFKQIMEAGEIATTAGQPAGRR